MDTLQPLNADAVARLPGQAVATIAKFAMDNRRYLIDCEPLLRQHELAVSAELLSHDGLIVTNARTRLGRYLELQVAGGSAEGSKHRDYPVVARVTTSDGQFVVQVAFRVYP